MLRRLSPDTYPRWLSNSVASQPNTGHIRRDPRADDVQIGVILALELEAIGIAAAFGTDRVEYNQALAAGTPSLSAWLSRFVDKKGRERTVAFTIQPEYGNNQSAICATRLKYHFPALDYLILCGMAGGAPTPGNPEKDVHKGDVVVSSKGILHYDLAKEDHQEKFRLIGGISKCGPDLIAAAQKMQIAISFGERPWDGYAKEALGTIKSSAALERFIRPQRQLPLCGYSRDGSSTEPLPRCHRADDVRVFFGVIGSANRVLRNPRRRDLLRDDYDVLAIEMEGAGVASAAHALNVQCLVVKGIADYCDSQKEKTWQAYSALVAASVARAIIDYLPSSLPNRRETLTSGDQPPSEALHTRIFEVNGVTGGTLGNDYARRAERLLDKIYDLYRGGETLRANRYLHRVHSTLDQVVEELDTSVQKSLYYKLAKAFTAKANIIRSPSEETAVYALAQRYLSKAKAVM